MTEFEMIHPTREGGIKPLYLVGLGLIVLALVLGFNALGESLTPYVNVAEARSANGAVQVMGFPRGSGAIDNGVFRFTMEDEQGQPITVEYHQPKPGNFDQAVSVVAVGSFDPSRDVFVADDLLVKCPSKYQEQGAPAGGR